ncbi:hypothetical protein P3G55_15470 [Leptospira sp. 96542]|nr:hypothetical protein [Leptospira sp. 96542]
MNFSKKHNHLLFYILSLVVIVLAIYQSIILRWICDDAYISFVYAKNLINGNGLVFNVNEYVEGFTNFLWTVFIAFGIQFFGSPQWFSVILGIFFYVSLLVLFFTEENKMVGGRFLPLLTIHLAMFYHLWVFSTSGLETMCFTFFLSLGLLKWEKKSKFALFFFCLASFLRPEGILFFSILTIELIKCKNFRILFLPVICLLCFFLFRVLYFGDLLPNTYFAKANRGSYGLQGLNYLFYLLKAYPLYLFVISFAFIRFFREIKDDRLVFFRIFSIMMYIVYVLYIGGDFMALRFWIPILPILSYYAVKQIYEWDGNCSFSSNDNILFFRFYKSNQILFHLLFLLASIVYIDPLVVDGKRTSDWKGIGEEREFYKSELMGSEGYDQGALQNFNIAFFGAQAHFVYFLEPKYAFESESGLTDRQFARKKIEGRGRIGHESNLEISDLRERSVELLFANKFPYLDLPHITYNWRYFPIKIYILVYEPNKVKSLCHRANWNCENLFSYLQNQNFSVEAKHSFYPQ